MDREKGLQAAQKTMTLGVRQRWPGVTPDQEKAPLIRTLGRVIYFDSVEEGAKLHEAFPHSPAEISSGAAAGPPPRRERGILRALRESGALESCRAQTLLVQSQRRKQQRTSHHSLSTLSQHCQWVPLWLIHCLRQGNERKKKLCTYCDQLRRGASTARRGLELETDVLPLFQFMT